MILITGSKGSIGAPLTSELRKRGHDIFECDLYHTNDIYVHKLGAIDGENYSRCDISEYRQISELIEHVKPDFIYNCAGHFGRHNGERHYEQLWKTNAIGVKNILHLQERHKFKLVHFSSSEIYGDINHVMFENVPKLIAIEQMNDYAMSKWVNEMQIRNSARLHNTETVILRLFNIYGPGEKYTPFRSVNCRFMYDLLNNKPITVFRGHTRTSSYIDDAVFAIANIVDNFKTGECYNIASDYNHTIEELAKLCVMHTGADETLINYVDNHEPMTTKDKFVNTDKAKRDLGMKQTITLDEGVKQTVRWMREFYRIHDEQ